MFRPHVPLSGPSSKASTQTLCQKCLKRGHFSFDCKVNTQDRPYKARPSRTQQLADPTRAPRLDSDVQAALLRKEGVADEELAKKQKGREETERKHGQFDFGRIKDRSLSLSSDSSRSISTISTSRSHSPSQARSGRDHTGNTQTIAAASLGQKRRRYSSSVSSKSTSTASRPSRPQRRVNRMENSDSPERTNSRRDRHSGSVESSHKRLTESTAHRDLETDKRRRRLSRSPEVSRGRHQESRTSWRDRDLRQINRSRDRGEVIRHRKSLTPSIPTVPKTNATSSLRERSLSPFSKRLALTQALNRG